MNHPLETARVDATRVRLTFDLPGRSVFGTGERFDAVDRSGGRTAFQTVDQFTGQGASTYLPVPFFLTECGQGAWIETTCAMQAEIRLADSSDRCTVVATVEVGPDGTTPAVHFYEGTPAESLAAFVRDTGAPVLPPKWSLGVWMSANRWNSQEIVEREVARALDARYPATVVVIEAWSDESTFHEWNPGVWPDPAAMTRSLHAQGMRLVLWQIPVLKQLDAEHPDARCERENAYAAAHGYAVLAADGQPFRLPADRWFARSMLFDFTNPDASAWWFEKRRHLLDLGVDGFKTDGGEMVYDPESRFSDGSRGYAMRNRYPALYTKRYADFVGPDRILFSRAGTTGAQTSPMHWAGDQLSTFAEFRSALRAGLSAGLSGVLFWTFDVAGFTGPLPSPDLYRRGTQAAAYTAALQWHSDMPRGQYGATLSDAEKINDRSPWNLAETTGDPSLLVHCVAQAHWRMNLLPHVYNEALASVERGLPLMRHLMLDFPDDPVCLGLEDQFLLGGLLVAPVLEEGATGRSVHLPAGRWTDLWSGEERDGGRHIDAACGVEKIPVFLRNGCALPLNLDATLIFASDVGNRVDAYDHLTFVLAGETGRCDFRDDLGNGFCLDWKGGAVTLAATTGEAPPTLCLLSRHALSGPGVAPLPAPGDGVYRAYRLVR